MSAELSGVKDGSSEGVELFASVIESMIGNPTGVRVVEEKPIERLRKWVDADGVFRAEYIQQPMHPVTEDADG
jgi:hypothetical protein